MNTLQVLSHITKLQFRPFTKNDWNGFAGCESENPLIAEDVEGNCVWVIDGDVITCVGENGSEGLMWELKET